MRNCILCGYNSRWASNGIKTNLGEIYPSLFLDSPAQIKYCKKQSLALKECLSCGFVQLDKFLEPDEMYRKYWYRSGLNNSMVTSLEDIVKKTLKKADVRYHQYMDIGCNDGTLLSFYGDNEGFRVGYDPANNLAKFATENCDVFVNDYFNGNIHYQYPFDIITSIAMFYDVPEPKKFVESIKNYLAIKGIWVVQMTDLTSMLAVNAYDNICHEHIAYYRLKDLIKLVKECGLEVFDIEYNDVNGGSIRAYIAHEREHPVSDNVSKALVREAKILAERDWNEFNRRIRQINNKIANFVIQENAKGKKIYGLGASTKGNTFLQCAELNNSHIPYILEVSKDKFGKFCAGSDIEIISEAEGLAKQPDYLLVLPWHFINFFLQKQWPYLCRGGKLIVPMPEPGIWSCKNGIPHFESLDISVQVFNE